MGDGIRAGNRGLVKDWASNVGYFAFGVDVGDGLV